jgi:ABC-type ATPase involved in cell division
MPRVDLVKGTTVGRGPRVRQLEGMFDVPHRESLEQQWHGDVPYDAEPWNVGLIVGPSGAGKTSLARELFGADRVDRRDVWTSGAVIEDIAPGVSMEDVTAALSAVGFNTVTAWMRPFSTLSNGEQFRASVARAMLETPADDIVVIDEFTSVVDRQVAQLASHAVQKYVRKSGKRLVAVTCHYDVIDWLQPDWILDASTMTFSRRSVQPRPRLNIEIGRADYSAWDVFAPFHYLTAALHRSARCFVLEVEGVPASFAGVLYRPHPTARDVYGLSRGVTLPDYQGLGLAFVLFDKLGAAYKACGKRLHLYPAHPSFIRSADRSPAWAMIKRPGTFSHASSGKREGTGGVLFGGRPNATFEYVGPALDDVEAARLLTGVKA